MRRRRPRAWIVAAAVVLALAGAGVAVAVIQDGGGGGPATDATRAQVLKPPVELARPKKKKHHRAPLPRRPRPGSLSRGRTS